MIIFTFIAVPDGKEVDIVRISIEEKQRYPTVAAVDRNDEENAHNPTLLGGVGVPAEVLIDLQYEDSIVVMIGYHLAKVYYMKDSTSVRSIRCHRVRDSKFDLPGK